MDLKCPDKTDVYIKHSEHILYNNDKIKAIKVGICTIDVFLNYENIIITKRILKEVKPKVIESEIDLKLFIDNQELEDNCIEIKNSNLSVIINYEIINARENQTIYCWTDSTNIEIFSFDAPEIVVIPLSTGIAEINVCSVEYPDIIFKIFITII